MIDPNTFFSDYHWNASDMLLELQRQGFVPEHFVQIINILAPLHTLWKLQCSGEIQAYPLNDVVLATARQNLMGFLTGGDVNLHHETWMPLFYPDVEIGTAAVTPEYLLQILMLALGFDEPPPVIRPISGRDAVITRFEYSQRMMGNKITAATKRAIIAAALRLRFGESFFERRYEGMAGDKLTCYFSSFSYYKGKWHVAFSVYNWSMAERAPGASPYMVESGQINNIEPSETREAKNHMGLIADWGDRK